MIRIINSIIEHRVKKLPMTNVLKDSFGIVGSIFGGCYGFSNSLHNCNGVVWRTSCGIAGGGVLGFTVGLFPYHTFGLLLVGDVVNTISTNYKKNLSL
jgi:hypothetical protein